MKNSRTPESRSVEIDGLPPLVGITIGKVVIAKRRQIIPVRPQMVVHDVENHAESSQVRFIDEPFQGLGVTVDMRRRIRPTPSYPQFHRPGKLRHRHDLNDGDAEILQRVKAGDGRIEGPSGVKAPICSS